MRLCQDLTEAIGMVPILRLRRLSSACQRCHCYLKLESCNPGGSIKEKNVAVMIQRAESSGELKPGATIIESSSGNFGVGLAMIGAARGYRVIIVVDAKTTPAFRRMLEAYGAELSEVELDPSRSAQTARMDHALSLALSIEGAWYPCQHYNPTNPDAHALLTAREIESAFGGQLDALVVGISTGGQLSGLARYLKPRYPQLSLVGVDVSGSVIFDTPPGAYKMTGIGLSFRPPNLDYHSIDVAYVVPEALAYSTCHALAKREGLLLGASTGAIVAAGMHFASTLPPGSTVAMINPDRGERYLETIYDAAWLAGHGFEIIPPEQLDEALAQLQPCDVPR